MPGPAGSGRRGGSSPPFRGGRSAPPLDDVPRQPAFAVKEEFRTAVREDLDPKPRRLLDGGNLFGPDRRGEDDGVDSQVPVRPGVLGVEDGEPDGGADRPAGDLPPREGDHAGIVQDHLVDPRVPESMEGRQKGGEIAGRREGVDRGVEPRPRPPAGGDRRPDRLRGEPCPCRPGRGIARRRRRRPPPPTAPPRPRRETPPARGGSAMP